MQPCDLSASHQHIASEICADEKSAVMILWSFFKDLALWPILRDHECKGVTLVPSGLYGDVSSTVVKFLWIKKHLTTPLPGTIIADKHVSIIYICETPQKGSW